MTRPPAPAAAAAGAEALSRWERYDRRVLAGLVRLPACRPRHLAALLGMAEAAAQEALLRLRQRGWARDVQVSTARDVAQVWAPSPAVWASYAQAGADLAPLVASEHHLHDLLWDSEGTLAAAELVSRLAQGARERGLGVTEALRLRPSAPGAVFAGAQGMVLLVEEEWCTPLFVLVDRQEASFDRRRLLVRGWARLLAERPYMAGAMMLVVTPTREEMDQWDFLATVSRERKGIPPLPLYLATAGAIAAPWQVEWERAEGKGSTYLFPSLHRLGQVPLDLPLPFRGARAPVLPAWEGMRGKSGIRLKQPSPAGRQALVALLRHPACTAGEAAAFAGLGEEEAAKVLLFLGGGGPAGRMLALVAVLAGAFAPRLYLSARLRARQRLALRELPLFLDLLRVAVEAGQGVDAALLHVAPHLSGPLGEEVARLLRRLRLGYDREEAMGLFARRLGCEEAHVLVTAILQAERTGGGLAPALASQAEYLRGRLRQRAQEEARRAPIKMLFPMAFCLLPAMMLLLMGPAALDLMQAFQQAR